MKTLGLDLKIKPFCLSEHDISWVMQTYTEMTIEEKIGQLFCPIVYSNDEAELRELVQSRHIGGVLYRPGEARQILKNHTVLQEASKIPLLIAANLEDGA